MPRVLVLPDLHLPCMHQDLIKHAKSVQSKYKTNIVVSIGDLFHHNAISFYDRDPSDLNVSQEMEECRQQIESLKKAFPKMKICYGNHDKRVQRKASAAGIPDAYLKSMNEIYDLPKTWEWDNVHEIDGVVYCHGDRLGGGVNPAMNQAKRMGMSVVCGHFHSTMGVNYFRQSDRYLFGMQVGCGINPEHPLHQYNPRYMHLDLLSVGVVINGTPFIEPLEY